MQKASSVADSTDKQSYLAARTEQSRTSDLFLQTKVLIEGSEEIEILFNVPGQQKFFAHSFASLLSYFLAQFLILQQANDASGGFFRNRRAIPW